MITETAQLAEGLLSILVKNTQTHNLFTMAKCLLVSLFLSVTFGFCFSSEPIEISYVNDTHVCPSSRARWQDYTVYLETKSRLCMM